MKSLSLRELPKTLLDRLTNEKYRVRSQYIMLYAIFASISLFMTAVNVFTEYKALMFSTLIFGCVNIANLLLTFFWKKGENAVRFCFSFEMVALFTYFIISGEPEGFSAIWAALLPAEGMLLYGRKKGSLLSLLQFAVIALLFWTPFGRGLLQWDYTDSFLLRFPILYTAFYIVGFFFETLRATAQEKLLASEERYKRLATTDTLTGLENSTSYFGAAAHLERKVEREGAVPFGIVLMDMNGLKQANDNYGHAFGNQLMMELGKLLPALFPTSRCFRAGGDEFLVVLQGEDLANAAERLAKAEETLTYHPVTFGDITFPLSLAIGWSVHTGTEPFSEVVRRADKQMYESKKRIKDTYHFGAR